MFFSKKKNTGIPDLSWLRTDLHSHLLPGIDDGAPDLNTSMRLIKRLAEFGYKKLITTPHILWEIYPNTPDLIATALEAVKKEIHAEGIEIELVAAAEYFIDEYFEQQIKNRAPILSFSGNLVLVEFSMITAPMDLQQVIFDLQILNYQPVIAHPERYTYLTRKKEFFDDLKYSGCQLQLNLLSLSGYYGAAVQELSDYLIKKNYYDYAGTDIHHVRHLEALQKISSTHIKRLQDCGTIKNHLL